MGFPFQRWNWMQILNFECWVLCVRRHIIDISSIIVLLCHHPNYTYRWPGYHGQRIDLIYKRHHWPTASVMSTFRKRDGIRKQHKRKEEEKKNINKNNGPQRRCIYTTGDRQYGSLLQLVDHINIFGAGILCCSFRSVVYGQSWASL